MLIAARGNGDEGDVAKRFVLGVGACVLLSCLFEVPVAGAAGVAPARTSHQRASKRSHEPSQTPQPSQAPATGEPDLSGEPPLGQAATPTASTVVPPAPTPQPGAVAAWGENFYGQLGAFYRDPFEVSAIPVEGVATAVQLAPTTSFNLALLSDGTVVSWGGGKKGQLGTGRVKSSWEEGAGHVIVQEEDPRTHLAAGPLHGVTAVAAANDHAMALMQDGTVRTWGSNGYGQLGNGTHGWERMINVNLRLPKPVPGLSDIKAVAAGGASDYALTEAGTVLAWGSNTEGQLGIGQQGEHCETEVAYYPRYELCSSRPLPVLWTNPATGHTEELREVQAIAAGAYAAYAILKGGRVLSWGSNHKGQLGIGGPTWRMKEVPPTEVTLPGGAPLQGVVELANGSDNVLARLQGGGVVGWGSSEQGSLAGVGSEDCGREPTGARIGTREPVPCAKHPTAIPALEALHPEALAAGHHFGLALSAGSVYAWGDNEFGQLGSGQPHRVVGVAKRTNGDPVPTKVPGIGRASGVAAAGTHSLALLAPSSPAPPPLVTATSGPLSLALGWRTETGGGEPIQAERLLYRTFERTAEPEPAEQGKSEDEEGAPFNLALEPAYLTAAGERLEGGPFLIGQPLWAEPGGWSGARPIVFSFQWQRCVAGTESCTNMPGKIFGRYRPTVADVGYTIRVAITATGAEGSPTTVYTPTSGVVERPAEGARLHTSLTSLKPEGNAYTIQDTMEKVMNGKRVTEVPKALEATPYEVKLRTSGKIRTTVLTPLG